MKPHKFYTLGLTLCALVCPIFAWAIPTAETDLATAAEKAKATQTPMLVEFTGSDWCPPCKHLRKTVLDTPAFEEFLAEKGWIYVELDFPRKPGALPPEVMKTREEIMMRYGVRGFPSMLLLDSDANPYAVIVGPGKSPADYFDKLGKAEALKKEFKSAVADAQKQRGFARAEALAAAIAKLPPHFQSFQTVLIRDIIAADPEDRLGFAKKIREGEMLLEQQKMLKAFFEATRGKPTPEHLQKSRVEALKLLENKDLLPPIRLALNKFISDGYAIEHNLEKALEYLKIAQASDPESGEGKRLESWVQNMERVLASIKESEAQSKAKADEKQ
ncbi:MAG: thioredoxin family protein [Opitutales bacterium]|nr:thioredoxin family protein [Opitutales bacterium]